MMRSVLLKAAFAAFLLSFTVACAAMASFGQTRQPRCQESGAQNKAEEDETEGDAIKLDHPPKWEAEVSSNVSDRQAV